MQLPKTIPLRVVERLLEAARWQMHPGLGVPDSWEGLRDAAVLELLFATGLRVSELCGLQTREVDLIDGTLRICGKGAKERILQITNPDPSLITLTWWAGFCAGMLGLAKQLGWKDT